ncbi:MAG TPA: class I SAM-dependent methyltransferase [bacterium]|jgi:ubiquinone/menaquinone biosynthesis C-methylase UbiE|nr:class I SAM-dependent methyltransferase [bacterium]
MSAARGKARQAATFYDDYHQASDQKPADHPLRRRTHRLFRAWLRNLEPKPGGRLLDLSCGLGYFLMAAREHDASLRLEGLDHSAYAVREAQARVPEARVRRGDALKQPYPDNRFDTVTCLGSLEHYSDPEQGLAEIHRVLKPGGKALIYVPNLFFLGYIFLVWRSGETPHEAGQNEYERFETRQGWEELLKRQGFSITRVTKHNEMYATNRVPRPLLWLYALLVERWVPLNLSYCFGFYVVKDAQAVPRPR